MSIKYPNPPAPATTTQNRPTRTAWLARYNTRTKNRPRASVGGEGARILFNAPNTSAAVTFQEDYEHSCQREQGSAMLCILRHCWR